MFTNYVKVALRNLYRQRFFTAVNVIGLTLSMACCILIGLYLEHEVSYDRFHPDSENVFRVLVETANAEGNDVTHVGPRFLSSALANEFAEIGSAVQFRWRFNTFQHDGKEFVEKVIYAEPDFFKVLPFQSLSGDAPIALEDPNGIVITKALAEKIFGSVDVIGKSLTVLNVPSRGSATVRITAVLNDIPQNSHLRFPAVLPISLYELPVQQAGTVRWSLSEWRTYIRFHNRIEPEEIRARLDDLVRRTGGDSETKTITLQRLTDIHFAEPIAFDEVEQTNLRDVYTFAGIATLVFALACINYVVLTTARLLQRLKEVGIRKIIGATPGGLILQFLTEAGLLAAVSLPLAFGIVEAAYPTFGNLLGKNLPSEFSGSSFLVPGSIGLLVCFAALAGFYPALFFSRIGSVASLKRQVTGLWSTHALRKVLVVVQFSITVILLVSVVTMYGQLRYTRSKDMGFRPENRLVVKISNLGNRAEMLKQAALSHSAVNAATLSDWLPGLVGGSSSMKNPVGEGEIRTEFIGGDCDFLKTFQIRLADGRDLDCSKVLDTLNIYNSSSPDRALLPRLSIILNETAVKQLGLSEPVGKELNYSGLKGTVVGVVRDVHNNSLHSVITPTVIRYADYREWLVVAYQPGRDAEVVKVLNAAWDELQTKAEFSFFFLDDYIGRLYATDENFMNMTTWFSLLAIVLSCLGLLGLTVFSTEQRTKEIGVRKVLGASAVNVVGLLSKDFVKLVLVANVIAWPIAYLAMNRWLEDFAYRIEMSWWLFATAGGLALFISVLTVSVQAVKAALANPVDALRYE